MRNCWLKKRSHLRKPLCSRIKGEKSRRGGERGREKKRRLTRKHRAAIIREKIRPPFDTRDVSIVARLPLVAPLFCFPLFGDTAEEKCYRLIVDDYSTTDPVVDPSKSRDYKVTNTIFLPGDRSAPGSFRFLRRINQDLKSPLSRGHGCIGARGHNAARNFTGNYSFDEGGRPPRLKRLNLRRNPSCYLVGQLCRA